MEAQAGPERDCGGAVTCAIGVGLGFLIKAVAEAVTFAAWKEELSSFAKRVLVSY